MLTFVNRLRIVTSFIRVRSDVASKLLGPLHLLSSKKTDASASLGASAKDCV